MRRTLWQVAKSKTAIERFGFVQADPIRAPARAQDLILWQRVTGYRAGDLERDYPKLGVEEDFFVNYGFVPRRVQALMHPRQYDTLKIERDAPGLSAQVLEFVRDAGPTHPKALEVAFGKKRVGNYWGGGSQATTRVLDGLHYRGFLRVARRDGGIKVYEAARHLEPVHALPLEEAAQARGLLALILAVYAPLPLRSLGYLVSLSGYGGPHLKVAVRAALKAALAAGELERATVGGVTYVWPALEKPQLDIEDRVRFLAPFDPVVWDRLRFEHLHGWAYRFEAYTPPAKRQLGYYALPMLWQDRIVGWANAQVQRGELHLELGFNGAKPKSKAFTRALRDETERLQAFLEPRPTATGRGA